MTDAREIIVRDLLKTYANYGLAVGERADLLIQSLTSAGFRILGPDEIDQLCEDIQVAVSSMTGDCKAHHKIALNHMDRAIRALKEEQHGN